MTTIKSYTDINQSKKLAEILPTESADMHYWKRTWKENDYAISVGHSKELQEGFEYKCIEYIPCWSLAALLDVLQKTAYLIDEDANVVLCSYKTAEWNLGINNSDLEFITKSNPVDACVEMIIKLHEQKLL